MNKGTFCIIIGLLLIAAALSLTGYNLWDERRAGAESQEVLETLLPEIDDDPIPKEGRMSYQYTETEPAAGEGSDYPMLEDKVEYPDYVLNPNMDMPVKEVDGREYIGVISIPSLERELPVISEWNYPNLKIAPCRYTGSVYLDNMVICAHNYNIHFGLLKYLSYGDSVIFTDVDGNVFTYQVIEVETLQPAATEQMTTGDWDLTLFTCTVGGATRVTVRCVRV